MATRGVQPATLQKKCDRWKKVLRLNDWDITCRYGSRVELQDEDDPDSDDRIGLLPHCSIPEKIALILIRREYYSHEGYGVSWNIDTLILHELVHILQKMGKQGLPKRLRENDRLRLIFEEYNCDTFAAIIYFIYYNKI